MRIFDAAITLTAFAALSVAGEQSYDPLWRPSMARPRRATGTHETIPARQERVLVDLTGPGVIRHIWFTAALDNADQIAKFHRGVLIKAYWDGEERPSVEVPFGDFFAIGHGVQRPFECAG
jgi:hypothetical protein